MLFGCETHLDVVACGGLFDRFLFLLRVRFRGVVLEEQLHYLVVAKERSLTKATPMSAMTVSDGRGL